MTLGEIIIRFGADISKFSSGVSALTSQMHSVSAATQSAASTSTASFSSIGGSIMGAVASAGRWLFFAQNLVSSAIGFGSAMIGSTAAMEQTRIAFVGLLGSGTAADAMLRKLQDFAAATPFEFPELAKDAQMLVGMGFAASDVIPMMTAVGDAVAGVGAGAAGVASVVRVLGQMHSAGKINAQDMMQITSLGIPAWKILADSMHLTVAQTMDLSQKGLIPADAAVKALVAGMEKMYGGQMAGQAQTFNGLLSTLHDNINFALMAFVGPLFIQAKAGLTQLGNLVSSPAFQAFAATMGQRLATAFQAVASFIVPVVTNIGKFVVWLQQASGPAMLVRTALLGIGSALVGMALASIVAGFVAWAIAAGAAAVETIAATWPVLAIGAAIGLLVVGFIALYQHSATFRSILTALGQVFQQIGAFLASVFVPLWQQLVTLWQTQLLPLFAQLGAAIAPLMPVLGAIGQVIGGVVVIALVLLVSTLAGVVKGLAGFLGGVATVIGGIVQIFTGLIQTFSGVVTFITDLVTGHFDRLGADLGRIWQGIINIFQGTWAVIRGIFQAAIGLVVGYVTGFFTTVVSIFTNLYHSLVGGSIVPDMINGIVTWFAGLPGKVIAFITSLVTQAIAFFIKLNVTAIQQIVTMITGIVTWFAGLPGKVMGILASLLGQAIANFTNLRNALIAAAVALVAGILAAIARLPGQVLSFFNQVRSTALGVLSGLASAAFNAAMNIGRSIVSGLMSTLGNIISAAQNIANTIASYLPHSPAKQGPLMHLDKFMPNMMDMLAGGIHSGMPKINAAMNLLVAPTLGSTSGSATRGGPTGPALRAPSSGPTTVVLQINGRDLVRAMGPSLIDEIRLQLGGTR